MKRLIILLTVMASILSASADYRVSSISGRAQLYKHGEIIAITEGTVLDPADRLMIENGATIKILNSQDSKLYTIDTPGIESVQRLIYKAIKKAASNSAAVNEKLRLTREKDPEGVVFVEKGKVTRSLAVYDPEGGSMQMDADMLSRRLYTLLLDSIDAPSPAAALALTRRIDPDGLSFMVENTLSHPIYFNVFKISSTDGSVTISELGQPVGCYAILPTQFLAREQTSGLNPAEVHIMIMTDFYFDIDEVLSNLNKLIDSKQPVESPANIPLYLLPL